MILGRRVPWSVGVSKWGVEMRILQQNIAVLADNAANLVIQLRELEQLHEQLKSAQQSARGSRQIDRSKRTRIRWLDLRRRLRRR